jgi:thioredoxin-related protein
MLNKKFFFINSVILFLGSIFPKVASAQVKCQNGYLFSSRKYQQTYKKYADARQPPSGTNYPSSEPVPLGFMPFISKKNKCFLVKLHVLSSPQPEDLKQQIDKAFQRVNQVYQKAGIRLELFIISIYDQSLLEIKINQNEKEKVLLDYPLNYTSQYINLYVVDNLILDGLNADGAAMFPEDNLDMVFVKTAKFNDGLTLIHELGHFFGLFHTCETFGDKAEIGDDGLQTTPKDAFYLFDQQHLSDVCNNRFVEREGIRYFPPVENIMSLYSNCNEIQKVFLPEQLAYMRQIALHERKYLKTVQCEISETIHNIQYIQWDQLQYNSVDYLVELSNKKQTLIIISDNQITWCQKLVADMDEHDAFVAYVKKEVNCVIVNPKRLSEKQREELLGNLWFRNGQEGIKIFLTQKYLDPNFAFYPTIILLEQVGKKIVYQVLEGYQSIDGLLIILEAKSSYGVTTKK